MVILQWLLIIGLVWSQSTTHESWFRCKFDSHCIKVKGVCGVAKAISLSFDKQYAAFVKERSKIVDCSLTPDPSDPKAQERQREEMRLQKDLQPYCLKNVCALH